MKTILVCAQKGGVGKTTIADELAFSLDRAKLSYNFYDLDAQGGCIHEKQECDDAEYSIVDTPGALQEDMVGWMKSSDLIIIPTRPSMRDIPPLQTMIDIVSDNKITVPVIFFFFFFFFSHTWSFWNINQIRRFHPTNHIFL